MGNFMIPVCCICGACAKEWHNSEWKNKGGLQDFCPTHAKKIAKRHGKFQDYMVPHMGTNITPVRALFLYLK